MSPSESKPFQSKQLSGLGAVIAGGAAKQSPAARAAADRRTAKSAAATAAAQPTQPLAPVETDTTPALASVPPQPVEAETPEPEVEGAPTAPRPAPVKRTTRKRRTAAHPRFDELERKESRFREDQLGDLAAVSKRLQRSKPKGMGGERITDNTLIRVAVDLLLEQADQLTGYTEKDILESAIKNTTQGDT